MEDKFALNTSCAYCGKDMDAKYRSKRFCSDKCRVYFGREKKLHELMEETLEMNKEEIGKILGDVSDIGMSASKTFLNDKGKMEIKRLEPLSPQVSAAIYNAEHKDSHIIVEEKPFLVNPIHLYNAYKKDIDAAVNASEIEKICKKLEKETDFTPLEKQRLTQYGVNKSREFDF